MKRSSCLTFFFRCYVSIWIQCNYRMLSFQYVFYSVPYALQLSKSTTVDNSTFVSAVKKTQKKTKKKEKKKKSKTSFFFFLE